MKWNTICLVISLAILFVGIFESVYQIYRMTVIDATARGLKHPRFWGLFAMSGNNSSGLLMYLIGRRKYPVINMTETDIKTIEKRKKSAGIGLFFIATGAIGLVIFGLLFQKL